MKNRARIIIPIIVLVVISIISGIVISLVYQSMEEVGGRTYLLNVPENSNEKLPLVVALHGSGGNGFEFQQASGLDSEAFITDYPVSLIHIHGDEDLVVPLEGGKGLFDTVLFAPAETGVKTFIVADECSSESLVVSGKVKKQLWSNCSRNTAVSFITVREQGHGWFDSDSFSSTKTMIDFLSAHPRQ